MKQFSLVLLLLCLSVAGYAQYPASSYGFTATTGTFSSISSSGTVAYDVMGDDWSQTDIPIGFDFEYCGVTYTNLTACSNGWLSLANVYSNTNQNDVGPSQMATVGGGVGMLMAYWDDLMPNSPGMAYYTTEGVAPNRRFIFEWSGYGRWTSGGPVGTMDYQVILYETTNVIEYVYNNGTFSGASATIGIGNSISDYQTLSDVSASPTATPLDFMTLLSSSPANGQIYRFTPPPPCSGSIVAGTAHSDLSTACSTDNFTLSLTGTTGTPGLGYQWQRSIDFGTTWTDEAGATGSTYTTTETSGDMFRAMVTCIASGYTDSSASVYVDFSPVCYCMPSYVYSPSTYTYSMGLDMVSITGYSGSTLADAGPVTIPASGYEDRTGLFVNVQQGETYSGSLSYITSVYQYQSQIWIDFNDDGIFDASEAVTPVISSGISSWALSDVFSIFIPITAPVGGHRMRVRYADMDGWASGLSTTMDPCNSWDGTNNYRYGVTRDYTINIIAAPACAGDPVGGTATATATLACPATDFTLNVSGVTVATGLTYQWEDSSASTGGSWNLVPGASTYPYNTSITEPTWFRLRVSCAASSSTATSIPVFVNYFGYCYCVPTYWGSPVTAYNLDLVTLTGYAGSNINDYGPTPLPSNGYQDRTSISVDLQQGNSYSGTLTYTTTSWDRYVSQIWIDFNDNGTFETTEAVTGVISSGTSFVLSDDYTLNIPLSAPTGSHRMRVRFADAWPMSTEMDPCASYDADATYYGGTTRDYMANIIAAPACAGVPDAGVAAASTTLGCPSTDFSLSVTGSTVATGLSYQWQDSSASTGGAWVDIASATSATYSTSISEPTWYHLVVTCTASGLTDTTNNIFVNYLGFCYCVPSYVWSPATDYSLDVVTLNGYAGSNINDAGPTPLPSNGYQDRTTISVDLIQGGSYSGILTYTTTSWDRYVSQIWIDFNDNGTFETSETVTGVISSGTSFVMSDAFTLNVPLTAPVGSHRMRVRFADAWPMTSAMDPCESYDAEATYYSGTTRDYTVNIILLPDCSGSPVVGAAVATPSSGGASIPFTLTAPGLVSAAGISYQWQSSSSSTGPWTNIPGATNTSYSFISVYADTWYQLVATCTLSGGATSTSDPVMITYVPTPPCAPDGSSWGWSWGLTSYGMDGFSVTGFSGTNINDAGITSVTDGSTAYLDHTSLPAVSMEQGLSYSTSVDWINPWSMSHQAVQVWVDFNDDGIYEASEEVSPVAGFDVSFTPDPTNFNITIPSTAPLGTHNMRVRAIYEDIWTSTAPAHLDPCAISYYGTMPTYYSGNAVDYRVTIVPPCLITATATTAGTVCPGEDVTLIGTTTAPTYSWSGPGGFTSSSLTATAPGVTSAAVYTLTATDGACTLTATATQSLYPAALPPVIAPATSTICNGSVQTLTATVPGTPGIVFSEDFNSGMSAWTVDNTGMTSTSSLGPWQTQPDGYTYSTIYHSPDNTAFAITNADNGGSGSTTSTRMISPTFSLAGMSTASLSFQHIYQWYSGDNGVKVEISTDGGSSWSLIHDFDADGMDVGTETSFQTSTFSLDAYLGSANTQIRFFYNSVWGFWWAVDNVVVTATPTVGAAPTWAPTTNLFADAALTTPYTGTAQYEVYTYPTTVTTTTAFNYVASVALGTCSSKDTATVNVTGVSPIVAGGSTTICAGMSVTLTNADAGGTWTISDGSIATVNSSGVVTGIGNGTATVFYNISGCSASIDIHSSNIVTDNAGTTALCTGGITSVLTNPTSGGTWSGGSASVATIASDGTVTSVGAGSTIITYTMPSGCMDTSLVTVQAPPAAITGTASVCYAGGTTTLSNTTPGGTWSSSNSSVATVDAAGVVTGLTSGAANITYTTLPSCYAVVTLTMNANPAPIGGTGTVCTGSVTTLTDITGSGTWSSGSTGVATVNSSTGAVSGVSNGNAVITFTASNGCYATTTVTVNQTPNAITGTASVCYAGGITTLSSTTPGGNWSSSNTAVATVAGGVVTGVTGGAATISYTMPLTGCYVTRDLTLNANPPGITGTTTVCAGGAQTTLANAGGTGTWTSGATSIATVGSGTGVVTGVSNGTANITFTDGNGCRAVTTVTVNALPAAITGTTTICNLASTTLADVSLPGTWSTTTPAITTVNASGMVTGVTPGIGSITFTQTSTGCSRSTNVTVNALPTSITGPTSLCATTTGTFAGAPTPGTWSSSPTAIATIESGTGIVHAVSAGTANITYTNGVGCYITTPLTVNAVTAPSVTINSTPGTSVCEGTTVNYSATVVNGGTPTYSWTVNSIPAGSSSTYSYVPNDGDIVGLTVTSSLGCAIPTTASATITMTVNSIVIPTLNINGTHSDTACDGGTITINTFPSSSAVLPTYQWFVNGTPMATGSAYTYTPAAGDEVLAIMTAGVACLSGSGSVMVADTLDVTIAPVIATDVALSSTTGATACAGNIVVYEATGNTGGSFLWTVNGVNVATGPTYFYTPADGDMVLVTMTSNYLCAMPTTDTAQMSMTVVAGATPVVTITTAAGGIAYGGESNTFSANIISGGGSSPAYQWYINGVAVSGANMPSFTTTALVTGDVVTCRVTNADACGGTTVSNAISTLSGVGVNNVTKGAGTIMLVPNPNKGSFEVKGTLGVILNEDITLEVTDMLGQTVYTGHTQAKHGEFSQAVQLSGTLANGMYMLTVRSEHMNSVFHFVLEQ